MSHSRIEGKAQHGSTIAVVVVLGALLCGCHSTTQEPVTSGQIALTTQTAPAADELARLAGQPG